MMIEHTNPQMLAQTSKKFEQWNKVVRKDILEKGSPKEINDAYKLLSDPTIYAYAFFKNNKNKPFECWPYQDLILNDTHDRIIFCAANQIGKSVALCIKALVFALHNPGKTVLMISKTFPQSKDLLRQIKSFLQTSSLDYDYDVGDSETKTEIYFKHFDEVTKYDAELGKEITSFQSLPQSRIICTPSTEAALGYSVDLLLIDELAFYEDGEYFYKQIAQPRTYTTKGKIITFSNPNGQQGIFWELWNTEDFHKYRFDFLDCPGNTQEEFDRLCKNLTREQIDSTLRATFTSPEGGFISLKERMSMQEDRPNIIPSGITQPVYVFFDFAKVKDRTVRCIGIPYGTTEDMGVYVYEMKEYAQGTEYDIVLSDLDDLVKTIGVDKIAMIGWDNTGVGRGIESFITKLTRIGITCTPVEFSLQNKSAMYITLKLLIEKNLRNQNGIKVPKITECDKQLSTLRFNKSSRGYWQVHHENEKDRDDFPDAIAGLCSLIVQPDIFPVSVVIVDKGSAFHEFSEEFKEDDLKKEFSEIDAISEGGDTFEK